jgi:LacI family transcriptional regulator
MGTLPELFPEILSKGRRNVPKDLSLEDIARLSGVSRSTVSRVINDQPYVSQKNREKVLRIIREHNFQPNLAARALASQRSRVIGVLIPHDVSDLFADPFFPILLKGITLASNELGYGVTLWLSTVRNHHRSFYDSVFNESLIDGLIIASATFDETFLKWLSNFRKPSVFVGAAPSSMPNVSFVDVDNRNGGFMATRHLLDIGCHRIGMIEGRQKQSSSDQRREGYIEALEKANLPIDPELIIPHGNYTESGGYEAMKRLLVRNVDGVFAASDIMALGAMRAIREAGLRVPQDIAVIGFDGVPYGAISNPPLSTISQPIDLLGEETARTLTYVLDNDVPHALYKILPVALVVRESTSRTVD